MRMIPFKKQDLPAAHSLVCELLDTGVIDETALLRPHPLSADCFQSLDDGTLSRRDFVWLMKAREDEYRRYDFNAARRAEGASHA